MAQGLNGELLGYGYNPLPLMDPLTETGGQDIATGNPMLDALLERHQLQGPGHLLHAHFLDRAGVGGPFTRGALFGHASGQPQRAVRVGTRPFARPHFGGR